MTKTNTQSPSSSSSVESVLSVDALALISRAEQGLVPSDLAGCEQLLVAADRVEHAAAAIRWVAIAAGRSCPELAESPTGRSKRSPWIEWVMSHYAEYGNEAHIHHMGAVGTLLIRSRKVCGGHHTLYGLPFDTLLALSRLPDHLLGPVLKKYDLAVMERGKIRKLVANCLKSNGLPTEGMEEAATNPTKGTKGKGKAEQLDFLDTLFSQTVDVADSKRRQELVQSQRVQPRVAAINGLYALGIAAEKWAVATTVDESDLEETIDELDKLRTELVDRLANRGPLELEA